MITEERKHHQQVAGIIRDQIGTMVQMRIGAREFMFDDNALLFRVGPNNRRRCKITLRADDTYKVELIEQKGSLRAGTLKFPTTFVEGGDDEMGLYADILNDSMIRMEQMWA